MIDGNEKPESVKLESAIDRIKYLEEEVNEMKAKVESLERAVETKDELIDQFKGRNEMLEMERIDKDGKLSKYNGVCAKMTREIKKLTEESKSNNDGTDSKAKCKKLTEQLKEKDRKAAEMEKKMLELMKKLGEETNKKVEAENRLKSMEKNLDNVTRIVEIVRQNKEQSRNTQQSMTGQKGREQNKKFQDGKEVCRDITRPGGCTWGSTCKFYHPVGVGREEQVKLVDCVHWMEGSCRFTDDKCKYIHDPKKKDTKAKSNKKDFAEALAMVKEVRMLWQGAISTRQIQVNKTCSHK